MNLEFVTRILKLIDKTGDKVVLMDPGSDRAIVVMDLEQYEGLVSEPSSEGTGNPQVPASEGTVTEPAPKPEPAPEVIQPTSEVIQPTSEVIQPTNQEQPFILEDEPTATPAPVTEPITEADLEVVEQPAEPLATPGPHTPSVYTNPGQKDPLAVSAFTDLTQSELLDKINRDIATWKTAQDRKRTAELQAAVSPKKAVKKPAEVSDALEEEERFYLEPVE